MSGNASVYFIQQFEVEKFKDKLKHETHLRNDKEKDICSVGSLILNVGLIIFRSQEKRQTPYHRVKRAKIQNQAYVSKMKMSSPSGGIDLV